MPATPSQFIWYGLCSSNPAKAAEFYGAVLGWTVQGSGPTEMNYKAWLAGGEGIGGLLEITPDMALGGMEDGWLGYVDVEDVDASVATIVAKGGHSHMAQTVPGVGRMAMVSDPQGAAFYVMKPEPTDAGPSPAFAPRVLGHGGWNELHTKELQCGVGLLSRTPRVDVRCVLWHERDGRLSHVQRWRRRHLRDFQ